MKASIKHFIPVIGASIIILLVFFFGNTGWSTEDDYMANYTGANAEATGSRSCAMCHRGQAPDDEFTHATMFYNDEDQPFHGHGCEGCHGPGGNHMGAKEGILNFPEMPQNAVTDQCSKCHHQLGYYDQVYWHASSHKNAGFTCVQCHSGHSAYEHFLVMETDLELCGQCHSAVVGAYNGGTHGRVEGTTFTCADCHNVHKQ